MRIDEALATGRAHLMNLTETAALEAELLLCEVIGKPRSHLRAWPEKRLEPEQTRRFMSLLDRRAAGEPLAYITGRREFWSLTLEVTADVLIPRPDTETLVERALEIIPPSAKAAVADLGTGSGAIALAIASERPHCRIVATDRSEAALRVARSNAVRLGLKQVEFRLGDWCQALGKERFALLISNPPYIAQSDPHLEMGDLRHEPQEALVSSEEGLDDLQRIIDCAPHHLLPGGRLLIEHGFSQGKAVRELLRAAGFETVRTYCDLARKERVSEGELAQ